MSIHISLTPNQIDFLEETMLPAAHILEGLQELNTALIEDFFYKYRELGTPVSLADFDQGRKRACAIDALILSLYEHFRQLGLL